MTTFAVDSVKKATVPLPDSYPLATIIEKTHGCGLPESYYKFPQDLSPVQIRFSINSFLGAVHTAYAQHYPLVLSPDIIWQCVVQGFATHVNKNAEKLRHMFVAHEGKKVVEVSMDGFVKGSRDNNWEEALDALSEAIRENVGDEIHTLLTPDFSTTGPAERACAQVALMDTFKEYMGLMVKTSCGIPSITLEGTVEDWEKLREKTLSLSQFELQWWTDAVKPILDEFVNASSGTVNKQFWQVIYKLNGASGGPFVTGWIVDLFPYLGESLEKMTPNKHLQSWSKMVKVTFSGPKVAGIEGVPCNRWSVSLSLGPNPESSLYTNPNVQSFLVHLALSQGYPSCL